MPVLTVLSASECWRRLRAEYTALLAFAHAGDLHVLPVNVSAHEPAVWFRTEDGTKMEAVRAGARMAVAVERHDEVEHRGWSVAARGPVRVVAEGPPPDRAPVVRPWRQGARHGHWVRIDVDTITGRELALGSRHADDA